MSVPIVGLNGPSTGENDVPEFTGSLQRDVR